MESYYRSNQYDYDDDDEQQFQRKDCSKTCKRSVPCIALLVVGGLIAIVAVVLHANSNSKSTSTSSSDSAASSSSQSSGSSAAKNATGSSACAEVAANDRVVVFWQSETDGCDMVPVGVTHVAWGFALVADGTIVPTFQSNDSYIKSCVNQLHSKCIASLGSIGGSTNNADLSAVTDAAAFATSAVALVDRFGFDGLDFDDEAVGSEFNSTLVLDMLQATHSALKAVNKSLLLTYDAYFYEGYPTFCEDAAYADYTRCFPAQVLDYVDWVNIMAYNVNEDNSTAQEIYASAVDTVFASWSTQLGGDFSKATIGVCVDSGCAFGPGPNATVIASWCAFAQQSGYGGMMVYAASSEAGDDFPVTRSIIAARDP